MSVRPRFSDYIITPPDIVSWGRSLETSDALKAALAIILGIIVGLWLGDWSAGLFAIGLVAALAWRIDSRWAFGLALGALIAIPLLQAAYNANLIFYGQDLANGLAVAVWYFLAIGVTRQVMELRFAPARVAKTVEERKPQRLPKLTRTRVSRPIVNPPLIPAWRRRLNAIEKETMLTSHRPLVDGIKARRSVAG